MATSAVDFVVGAIARSVAQEDDVPSWYAVVRLEYRSDESRMVTYGDGSTYWYYPGIGGSTGAPK